MVVKAEARLYELYEGALKRIRQLEALNATLAAQVDRQGKVVQAAIAWVEVEPASSALLIAVVADYRRETVQLAKEGR